MESPYTYQQNILKNISSPMNVNISLNESSNFNTLRPSTTYHNVHSSNPNTPIASSQSTYMPSPVHSETSPVSRFSVNSPISQVHASPVSRFSVNSPISQVHASSPSTFHQQSPAAQIKQQPSPAQPNSVGNSSSQGLNQQQTGSNMPHMMRIATAKSWIAAFPTYLTQSGFDTMCRSNALNEGNATFANLSHLERFLGCIYIRKNLQQLILKQDCALNLIHPTHPSEFNLIQFRDKNELFHFKILMHPETMQNLQIKITSLDKNHNITQDEIEIIERFFEFKVICEPFKPDAFSTFARIIGSPFKFVKDFIQLMKLELYPDRNCKWLVNWCLTISPGTLMRNLPLGMSAFLYNASNNKNTIVFFLQFTQNTLLLNEPQSIAVPIIYEINTNSMNIPIKDQPMTNLPTINMINRILQDASNRPEYPIYSSIKEVLYNDLIP